MRTLLAALGAIALLAYSTLGAILMTRWELEAASGLPIDATIALMSAASQPYSITPGIIFASFGVVFTIGWLVMTLLPTVFSSGWMAAAVWFTITAFGAPAYFGLSFGNMNSIGDTIWDWNSEASFALVSPLYIVSGIAAVLAVVSFIVASVSYNRSLRAPVPPEPTIAY